ncbi:YciI family protein [Aureliella helgolandensis]|uniref:YCII-related domain protein n=1 Tax=Aureliella helgolandensis TaxID=2527968 RepID=A0A518GAU7_9BACT|nr:YciI family protein [Aureliella helgolandensis]QDV25728.1 hypothetical protein Q31a_40550 [Aureliella helgolandensis]
MKVMVLVKATQSSEAGEMPSEQLLSDMGKFNQKLVDAGVLRAGEGLKPSSEGVRIHFSGSTRRVTEGPFAETKELIAGYWVWEVDSMEDAIAWGKRCPNPMLEDSDIEIRKVFEMTDFAGSDPSGAVVNQEDGLRSRLATQNAVVQPYLFFGGRCEEALAFYQQAAGAKVIMAMRFDESPDAVPEGMLQAGFEKKIMHASFQVGSTTIMASDGCDDRTAFSGFRLTLLVPTEADADLVFQGLADGGKIEMPLATTFWSPRYGTLTDKFGVGWMVMVPGAPQ